VVRIFEPGVRLDDRCRRKIGAQLGRAEEWAPVLPLAAIAAVANDPGAVREQLTDCRGRDLRMQALDVPPDAVVEAKLALFTQLHDAGGSKALRMGSHPETVSRRQGYPANEIGVAERPFEDDLALMNHGDHAARLLRFAQLVLEPLGDVVEGGLQPMVQVLHLSEW
jgi:hypothetical protein